MVRSSSCKEFMVYVFSHLSPLSFPSELPPYIGTPLILPFVVFPLSFQLLLYISHLFSSLDPESVTQKKNRWK